MTILEAIKIDSLLAELSDEVVTLEGNLRGINVREEANQDTLRNLEVLKSYLYLGVVRQPDFSEGKLSITHTRGSIMSFVRQTASKYGATDLLDTIPTSTVKDGTHKW